MSNPNPDPNQQWLQLLQLPITRNQKHKLIERFGSLSAIFESSEAWQYLVRYCHERKRPLQPQAFYGQQAEKIAAQCENLGWQILTEEHCHFPQRLRSIPDPPLVLFTRGEIDAVSEPQLAVVGSRKATPLGLKIAERFAKHLSDWGLGVVSGLALGIDSAAHKGALSGPTPTSAVLANGPDKIYPHRNRGLAEQIIDGGGVLITENPPGSALDAWRFPERNRLISGLALGTLVVEADIKSGSLVTAKLALSQGAEVFAVPGALSNPQARGCHQLIKQGAVLVDSPDDIINALHAPLRQLCTGARGSSAVRQLDEELDRELDKELDNPLLKLLQSGALGLDELASLSDFGVEQLQVELAKLELDGRVERRAGRYHYSS